MKTLYQVGDKLLVREDLETGKIYNSENGTGNDVTLDMMKVKGKIVTVKDNASGQYTLYEAPYCWTDEMFVGKVVEIGHNSDLVEGDYVLIREDLEEDDEFGDEETTVYEDMVEHVGKVAKVTSNFDDDDFELDVDDEENYWHKLMFVGKVIMREDTPEVEAVEEVEADKPFIREEVAEAPFTKKGKREKADYTFQVGDEVIIKSDLEEGRYDSETTYDKDDTLYFNPRMAKYLGQKAKVTGINIINGAYNLDITGTQWHWSIGMLDAVKPKVVENETINAMAQMQLYIERVIFNEPATVLFYRVPDIDPANGMVKSYSNVKKIVAKCSPEDEFDKNQGIHVALLKAIMKETHKELRKI